MLAHPSGLPGDPQKRGAVFVRNCSLFFISLPASCTLSRPAGRVSSLLSLLIYKLSLCTLVNQNHFRSRHRASTPAPGSLLPASVCPKNSKSNRNLHNESMWIVFQLHLPKSVLKGFLKNLPLPFSLSYLLILMPFKLDDLLQFGHFPTNPRQLFSSLFIASPKSSIRSSSPLQRSCLPPAVQLIQLCK